jgi:hypothetical protein
MLCLELDDQGFLGSTAQISLVSPTCHTIDAWISVLLRKGSEMPIAIGLGSSLETANPPPMVFHLNRDLRAGCRQ